MSNSQSVFVIKKKHFYWGAAMVVVIVGAFVIFRSSSGADSSDVSSNVGSATGKVRFEQAVGQPAPDFTLESSGSQPVSLASLRGKNVVLFFNEGSMCYPGCWNQIKELSNDPRFNSDEIQALSIVIEPKETWDEIMREKPDYATDRLLFDTDRDAAKAYDVLALRSSMHRGVYPGHTYFVIDKAGIIRYVLDDPAMGIRNDQIISEIEKLSS